MHQPAVDVRAGDDRGAVEDSAVVKILEVTHPIPGPLLAPDPGVAILCNQRNADYMFPRILFVQRLRCHHATVTSISFRSVCNERYILHVIHIYAKII